MITLGFNKNLTSWNTASLVASDLSRNLSGYHSSDPQRNDLSQRYVYNPFTYPIPCDLMSEIVYPSAVKEVSVGANLCNAVLALDCKYPVRLSMNAHICSHISYCKAFALIGAKERCQCYRTVLFLHVHVHLVPNTTEI